MLTEQQKAIVRATVPLLETGGEALTTHFYKIMLSEHAEVRALFNSAHQQSGAQPRALANSVLMYAKNIDRLEGLGKLPAQIINKHVALQVQPSTTPSSVPACCARFAKCWVRKSPPMKCSPLGALRTSNWPTS